MKLAIQATLILLTFTSIHALTPSSTQIFNVGANLQQNFDRDDFIILKQSQSAENYTFINKTDFTTSKILSNELLLILNNETFASINQANPIVYKVSVTNNQISKTPICQTSQSDCIGMQILQSDSILGYYCIGSGQVSLFIPKISESECQKYNIAPNIDSFWIHPTIKGLWYQKSSLEGSLSRTVFELDFYSFESNSSQFVHSNLGEQPVYYDYNNYEVLVIGLQNVANFTNYALAFNTTDLKLIAGYWNGIFVKGTYKDYVLIEMARVFREQLYIQIAQLVKDDTPNAELPYKFDIVHEVNVQDLVQYGPEEEIILYNSNIALRSLFDSIGGETRLSFALPEIEDHMKIESTFFSYLRPNIAFSNGSQLLLTRNCYQILDAQGNNQQAFGSQLSTSYYSNLIEDGKHYLAGNDPNNFFLIEFDTKGNAVNEIIIEPIWDFLYSFTFQVLNVKKVDNQYDIIAQLGNNTFFRFKNGNHIAQYKIKESQVEKAQVFVNEGLDQLYITVQPITALNVIPNQVQYIFKLSTGDLIKSVKLPSTIVTKLNESTFISASYLVAKTVIGQYTIGNKTPSKLFTLPSSLKLVQVIPFRQGFVGIDVNSIVYHIISSQHYEGINYKNLGQSQLRSYGLNSFSIDTWNGWYNEGDKESYGFGVRYFFKGGDDESELERVKLETLEKFLMK